MRILMTGATGFLGRRLLRQLLAGGHEVTCASRHPPAGDEADCTWLKLDLATTSSEVWAAHLRGVDAVVNLVGIFRERGAATFQALHTRGPIALFDACHATDVQRVLQVSALGADARADTPFLASKYRADRHLLTLPLDAAVAQPSLVFGVDGASAQQFLMLASLPVLLLPAGGLQRVQPVHVDDVVRALMALLLAPPGALRGRRLALVGPHPLTLADYLRALRRGMGWPAGTLAMRVPDWMMRLAARLGDWRQAALLDSASWTMLQRGNTADASVITALLGRPPRPAREFIATEQRAALRTQARLVWLHPLLRLSLAIVWLWTAYVSLAAYPVQESYALLERAGVPARWQPLALWSASGLDLALGLLTLWRFAGQRWLWLAQGLLMLFYSVVIALQLPEFWLHPYGPLTKNLPMLGLLALLWFLEPPKPGRDAWST